jgi:hypothetical protein
MRAMSPKELTAFRMDPELMAGLRAVKERDGIPLSVQIHRAVEAWLASKGVKTKTANRRAATRRKA